MAEIPLLCYHGLTFNPQGFAVTLFLYGFILYTAPLDLYLDSIMPELM